MTHLILFGNLTVNELCQTFIFQWGQLFWKYLMFDLTIDSLLTKLCNFFLSVIAVQILLAIFSLVTILAVIYVPLTSQAVLSNVLPFVLVCCPALLPTFSLGLAIKVFPCSLLSSGQKGDEKSSMADRKSGRWKGNNIKTFNANLCFLFIVFSMMNYWYTWVTLIFKSQNKNQRLTTRKPH